MEKPTKQTNERQLSFEMADTPRMNRKTKAKAVLFSSFFFCSLQAKPSQVKRNCNNELNFWARACAMRSAHCLSEHSPVYTVHTRVWALSFVKPEEEDEGSSSRYRRPTSIHRKQCRRFDPNDRHRQLAMQQPATSNRQPVNNVT